MRATHPSLPVFRRCPRLEESWSPDVLSWSSAFLHGITHWTLLSPRGAAPLLGFDSPTAHRGGENPRPDRSQWEASQAFPSPGFRHRVPRRWLRCRSQVFPTSQRLLLLSALPPFSDGWRSWGDALQGIAPSTKPRRLVAVGLPSWPSSPGLREGAYSALSGGAPTAA